MEATREVQPVQYKVEGNKFRIKPARWVCAALVAVLCAVTSLGCPSSGEQRFTYKGHIRSYRIYDPPSADPKALKPLLVSMHGLGMNAASDRELTQFEALADREGFIVVFPNAVSAAWRFPGYDQGVDDVGFILRLIDSLAKKYPVDPDRIYLSGFSHGGILAYLVACQRPSRIAAIGTVSSLTVPELSVEHAPAYMGIPLLMIRGDQELGWANDDKELVVRFNPLFEFVDAIRANIFWPDRNGCSGGYTETTMPDLDPADGTLVYKREYLNCDASAPTILYEVAGGEHAWPGDPRDVLGGSGVGVSRDINASELIWEFVSQFSLADREAQ